MFLHCYIEKMICPIISRDGACEYIIPEFIFKKILSAAIRTVKFDEGWYRKKYNDVDFAIKSGVQVSAWEHYVNFGFFENRMPYHIIVDEDYYINVNKDVAESLAKGEICSAQEHFENNGFVEGRLPYKNFTLI